MQKDPKPVQYIGGCGHSMEVMAYSVWAIRTEDGSWTDFYLVHEDKARGMAS